MTSARWKLVTQIFDAALDLPQSARNDFVREQCNGDQGLEAEVLRLLSADEKAGSFLEGPAFTAVAARSALPHPISVLVPGSVVSGRFKILRFIGQGGMGQVYEALDLELNVRVALKAIRQDISVNPRVLSRFRREVQLTRRITHPNVCRTFDIERHISPADDRNGIASDITFLTMELLEGETLTDLLRREGRLNTTEALPLVLQMIEALGAAHSAGVVHRDFKPSNVLFVPSTALSSNTPSPPGLRVVVTDFGLARAFLPDDQISPEQAATSLTGDQALMGTLIYMAPEQFERGEATVASDIYSLGLVMYEMVTGQRPFADPIPFAEAAKRLKHPAPSPRILVPELGLAWESAICRCLEGESGKRFGRVCELKVFLQHDRNISLLEASATKLFARKTAGVAKWKRIATISCVALLLVALPVGLLRLNKWRSQTAKLPAGSKILVTDVLNESHDPELNGATELLRSQLAQSAYMNLIEPRQVAEALERMSQPKGAELTPLLAREVAWRQGAPLVVFGTISRVAEDYRLDLKVERIGSEPSYPRGSWRFSETTASKKDFLDVMGRGATWVRRMAGEAPADIDNSDRRPEDATTNSWEALKLYSEGQRLALSDRDEEAALMFKRAAEKDPEFAMAWMRLGDTLDTIGKASEGFAYWRKALDVSGDRRLSPREELRIKGMYASDTGDLKAAVEYFSQYALAYPNDPLGFFYQGVPLMLMGQPERAIEVLHQAEKLAPNSYYIPDHLARYNLILGNYAEVSRYTVRVRQLQHPWWADEVDGLASASKGDYGRAQQLFAGLNNADEAYLRSLRYYLQACVLAEQGRYDDAIALLDEGAKADLPTGDAADRAGKLLGIAYLYLKKGDRTASRKAALPAVEAEPGVRTAVAAGTILARAGFVSDARRLLANLDNKDHFVVTEVARLRLHGEILLAQGNCQRAMTEFQNARDKDQEQGFLPDYLGHAFSSCGKPEEARQEFEKLRKYPGQVWHQPELYPPGFKPFFTSTNERDQSHDSTSR